MQQFIQDKILLSVYPWCTLEEAREKELQFWCIVDVDFCLREWFRIGLWVIIHTWVEDRIMLYNWPTVIFKPREMYDIIWLPPTLMRVLWALWPADYYVRKGKLLRYAGKDSIFICDWKEFNEDKTDCNFFQQSPESQKAIALLLWWKDEQPTK